MILEIFIDMSSFVLILLACTIVISLLYFISFEDEEEYRFALIHTYRLVYGDFDAEYESGLQWLTFLIGTILCPLVLLNLLIAIMGATYERV